ncbi:probable L-type lectin-domain containing receptor kinase S.7 [Dendrobium catenatum]|uniref:probable L-type lectin-domain containing receptor kinase S.7 n=1 Tax=Dendrobium catenatum TaxID=906689 RepID=UPI0009F182D9|nr:probable L-type lectin-domain containing receptor kinase S.7 [Dendrobium catenatum]
MASSPRSTFLLHISLTLLLHSQTLPKTAFSQNLFFHFPPFSNKNLVLLGSSSLRDGSLCLTNGSLSSSSFGAAIFLNPVAIIPLVSFSTSFSFLVTNPNQDLTSSSRNAIAFFLLPNSSLPALFQSLDAVKNASILFLEFPVSRYLKAASVNHITARISIHYKEGGMAVRVSAGEPRITIKEESQILISKNFVEHIYAGFFSSNQNSSESRVIQSWSLSSSIFHRNNPQSTWRIKLQSTKALKYSPSNTLLILIRASTLAISAAVIIVVCFNVKEQFSPDARKRRRERQLLLKDFRKFKYSEIVTGTRNFNEIIGFGGTSKVYKMNFPLSSSTFYAVKRFNTDKKSRKSYHNELETMSRVLHENILELKGWCDMDTGENLLVFDYMPQGSLHYVLHSRKNQLLPWTQRYSIAIKLATALKHLHEECSPHIVHGDIKGSNILLDDEYQPKLGDFGISLNGAPYKAAGASKQYSAPECKPKSDNM